MLIQFDMLTRDQFAVAKTLSVVTIAVSAVNGKGLQPHSVTNCAACSATGTICPCPMQVMTKAVIDLPNRTETG